MKIKKENKSEIKNYWINLKMKTPLELENKGKLLDEILKIITDNDKVANTFTRENFIKMFLLVMRIRANISTILMGETDSGKTYLLEIFSLIYSHGQIIMYILKFHAKKIDKDKTDFINNIIKKNDEEEENLIKFMIDEFNNDYEKDKLKKEEKYKIEKKKKMK